VTDTSLQAAYLLHYTTYRDTSFIVEAFTLEHGRVPMIARGARASKPRTRALYQPFRPLLLSWVGRSELRTLTGIEESGAPVELHSQSLACAYYLNELMLRLLGKDQAQRDLFAHYALALTQLASNTDVEVTLRTFEVQLLEALGVLPELLRCTPSGDVVEHDAQYMFYPANAVAVPQARAKPGIAEPTTRLDPAWHADGVTADDGVLVSGAALHAIASLDFSNAELLDDAKKVMRRLLRVQLGGKPLKSRSLFDTLVQPEAEEE